MLVPSSLLDSLLDEVLYNILNHMNLVCFKLMYIYIFLFLVLSGSFSQTSA